MKKYLITGGAGFFGSILKNEILNKGDFCVSIDKVPDETVHPNLLSIQGDIRDIDLLKKIFQENKFDAVFHLAAVLAHVNKDFNDLWSSNVEGTEIVAGLTKEANVKKIIFISSNCLWGHGFNYLVTEEEKPSPIEIYGKSKLEAEKILELYSDYINPVIFRSPTIIDEGRLGLLSILFEFIDENKKICMVGDGNNKYQFIYAKDLASACLKAVEYGNKGTVVFNIGSDNVKSFNDVYKYVIDNAGSDSKLIHFPKGFLELCMKLCYKFGISPLGPYQYKMISQNFVFDTSKIKKELDFTPTLTNEQMLLKAYNYYHSHRKEIEQRKNVSAHRQACPMGIIRLIKYFS